MVSGDSFSTGMCYHNRVFKKAFPSSLGTLSPVWSTIPGRFSRALLGWNLHNGNYSMAHNVQLNLEPFWLRIFSPTMIGFHVRKLTCTLHVCSKAYVLERWKSTFQSRFSQMSRCPTCLSLPQCIPALQFPHCFLLLFGLLELPLVEEDKNKSPCEFCWFCQNCYWGMYEFTLKTNQENKVPTTQKCIAFLCWTTDISGFQYIHTPTHTHIYPPTAPYSYINI